MVPTLPAQDLGGAFNLPSLYNALLDYKYFIVILKNKTIVFMNYL